METNHFVHNEYNICKYNLECRVLFFKHIRRCSTFYKFYICQVDICIFQDLCNFLPFTVNVVAEGRQEEGFFPVQWSA